MKVNTDIWGAESEWQVDTNLSSTSWQDTNLLFYNGKYRALSDYRTAGVFDYNSPIDYTICYSGHAAAEKMPLADIAIYNYQGTKKYTQEKNNGWFLAEQNSTSAGDWGWYKLLTALETGTPTTLYNVGGAYRWSPDAVNSSSSYPYPYNYNRLIRPIVKFSPKSFFGVVYVVLIKNDYSDYTIVSLKALKNNINTYKDTYFILKAYISFYGYNGRATTDGNFNNYAQKSLNAFGAATIQPIPVGDKKLITYYQTIGETTYGLPIAGITGYLERLQDRSYNTHYGVRVAPVDTSNNNEVLAGVTMAHLVESTYVDYFYSRDYGYIYLFQVKIPITTEVIDELYKGAAAYGIFFSDDLNGLDVDTTNVARWLNENMYCGVLDSNGIGHGEYTRGPENANNPVYNFESSQNSKYNPTGFDIFVGDKRVRKIYYRSQQIKTAYFSSKKL